MARGKRTDLEIQAEIITRLIKWELGSDISKDLWVHESTVSRIKDTKLQEVARDSDIISRIIDNDMESVENMSEITKRFTQELKTKQELERADIDTANRTTESAFKRSQLLQGKNTEQIGVSGYDLLQDIRSGKLSKEQAYEAMQKAKSTTN